MHTAMQEIPLHVIKTGGTNPRKYFDAAAMAELVESVKAHGVLQPVLLRPFPSKKGLLLGGGVAYELVAGERRLRAARTAGLDKIPALVRDLSDDEVLEIQVVENLQRQDLHPLEEADGYQQLRRAKYDVARIAERVGRSVAYIYDRLRLANLCADARQLFADGEITAGHAILLARLTTQQQALAIVEREALFTDEHLLWDPNEGRSALEADTPRKARSVRELQAWIDKNIRLDVEQPEIEQLFPEVAAALDPPDPQPGRSVEPMKVVQITHDHYIPPTARDGSRIIGPRSWKTATKACAFQATGVIVVGPGRGKAFPVCVEKKKCKTHWGAEIRAAAKAAEERQAVAPAKGEKAKADPVEDKWQAEQRKRQERRAQWERAAPEILKAVAQALLDDPKPHQGVAAKVLLEELYFDGDSESAGLIPRDTPENLLRHLALLVLAMEGSEYNAADDFPKRAKELFGLDLKPLVKAAAKAEPAPEPKPAKKAKGKAA